MIQIDREKCIGCGQCVRDCFPREIELVDGKAVPKGRRCMECGHCIAVCPTNAVRLQAYDMDQVVELKNLNWKIDPETYLNHLKSRRSIRQFTGEPVSAREIEDILQAGRYSPTGSNLQNVTYYVSQKHVQDLKERVMVQLRQMGEAALTSGKPAPRYARLWLSMYDAYRKDGTDRLFFDAGTVIVVSSDSPQSACLAAAHMETMVYSLGLGMLYSGFTAGAIAASPELKARICRKKDYEPYAVLVIGHPAVHYLRTAPRKPADVVWD